MKYIVGFICFMVLMFTFSFLLSTVIVKGICWAFGIAFSWKLAIGVWLVLLLLQAVFKTNVNVKK